MPSIKDEDCGVCDQPWRHAAILWDGRVAPCCNFYDGQFVLGDLNQNSMAEVWNGDSIVKFREQHITKKRKQIKECATCKQQAPSVSEKIALGLLDMATINHYISVTGGRRD